MLKILTIDASEIFHRINFQLNSPVFLLFTFIFAYGPTELSGESSFVSETSQNNYSGSLMFAHHCSPWIDKKIWYKIHSKPRISCHSTHKVDSSHSKELGRSRFKTKLSNVNDENENLVDSVPIDSDDVDHDLEDSLWWEPNHPYPRKMSDNFSPSVCSYTQVDEERVFEKLKDFLHQMRSYSFSECLPFDNNSISIVCDSRPNRRIEKIKNYCFTYCNRYPLINVLSDDSWAKVISNNPLTCYQALRELYLLDTVANDIACQFDDLLSRYQCEGYSIKGTCGQCKNAYKEWVCSMTLPFYFDGIYIKPCRSFCEYVERKCPHLHPAVTYAGEPVFICIDPRIPYFRNSTNVPYGSPEECYKSCHLPRSPHSNLEETVRDCPSYEELLQNLMTRHLKDQMQQEISEENDNLHNSTSTGIIINSNQLSDELVVEIPHEQNKVVEAHQSLKTLIQDSNYNFSIIDSDFIDNINTSIYAEEKFLLEEGYNPESLPMDYRMEIKVDSKKNSLTNPSVHQPSSYILEDSDDDESQDEPEKNDESISTTSTLPTAAPIVSTSLSNAGLREKRYLLIAFIFTVLIFRFI